MKLGLFTDPHYAVADRLVRTRRPFLSMAKLKEALTAFAAAQVDAIVCLGDWISVWDSKADMQRCLRDFAQETASLGVPIYTCLGNHDAEVFSKEEFVQASGLSSGLASGGLHVSPCVIEDAHARVLLLDANYLRSGAPWPPYCKDWTQTALPDHELDWLRQQLCCDKDCYICLHQNLDDTIPSDHVLENAAQVREAIHAAGNVRLVLQGHYHRGSDTTYDGIRYLTLRAMCEEEENSYFILDTEA